MSRANKLDAPIRMRLRPNLSENMPIKGEAKPIPRMVSEIIRLEFLAST